jgi:hypothetical protein
MTCLQNQLTAWRAARCRGGNAIGPALAEQRPPTDLDAARAESEQVVHLHGGEPAEIEGAKIGERDGAARPPKAGLKSAIEMFRHYHIRR